MGVMMGFDSNAQKQVKSSLKGVKMEVSYCWKNLGLERNEIRLRFSSRGKKREDKKMDVDLLQNVLQNVLGGNIRVSERDCSIIKNDFTKNMFPEHFYESEGTRFEYVVFEN